MHRTKAKGRTIGRLGAFPRVRPPARLKVFFASHAPIAVIARRGPSKYSQLILWNTLTDEFTPGQWTRGHVQWAELSRNGKYISMQIMGARPRREKGVLGLEQVAVLSRPPYFTALKARVGGFCVGNWIEIPEDLQKVEPAEAIQSVLPESYYLDASSRPCEGTDQRGRKILLKEGSVWLLEESSRRLLFDANHYDFEEVIAPDWALTYD
ncbi:MAG TPA: hypothetical protein VG944_06125 [Fimbriimonas sp.]|nr:hypothetical protein [Fimbriimonas sp.]